MNSFNGEFMIPTFAFEVETNDDLWRIPLVTFFKYIFSVIFPLYIWYDIWFISKS